MRYAQYAIDSTSNGSTTVNANRFKHFILEIHTSFRLAKLLTLDDIWCHIVCLKLLNILGLLAIKIFSTN